MHTLRALCFALVTLACGNAHAAAIYQWANNPGTFGTGTLTLSDQAYFAGGTAGNIRPYEGKIYYSPIGNQYGTEVDVAPMSVQVSMPTPGASLVMDIGPPWNPARTIGTIILAPNPNLIIEFALTVSGDGLSGFLRYYDGQGDMWMNGTAESWGNFQATSDLRPTQCRADRVDACDALGGRWVLVSAPTNAVPEPTGVALIVAGLAGLLMRRRPQFSRQN